MSLKFRIAAVCAWLAGLTVPAVAVDNLLLNAGFEGPPPGDAWGNWGNTGFNNFWGADVHASLFADWAGNNGGVFQGVFGMPETAYQFVLVNTRIEPNWSADLRFGFECYAADNSTKLGETMVLVNTAARIATGQVDGHVFTMQGTTVPGTVYVRPIFRFDNVNPNYTGQSQASAFVFNTFLGLAPAPGQEYLMNPGFEGSGNYWGMWGNAGFNAFFGANGHASFFADQVGNAGSVWQQGILGKPGAQYRFQLTDVRIEQNWAADLYFGLEYYGDDDFQKLGETIVRADTSTTGDGLRFSMVGRAVPGTVYVRPAIRFGNVAYSGGQQRSAFVFEAAMTEVPEYSPGDLNGSGKVDEADLEIFVACSTGPDVPYNPASLPSGCPLTVNAEGHLAADFDGDLDVDQEDFGIFQRCWSGTSPADPNCAD